MELLNLSAVMRMKNLKSMHRISAQGSAPTVDNTEPRVTPTPTASPDSAFNTTSNCLTNPASTFSPSSSSASPTAALSFSTSTAISPLSANMDGKPCSGHASTSDMPLLFCQLTTTEHCSGKTVETVGCPAQTTLSTLIGNGFCGIDSGARHGACGRTGTDNVSGFSSCFGAEDALARALDMIQNLDVSEGHQLKIQGVQAAVKEVMPLVGDLRNEVDGLRTQLAEYGKLMAERDQTLDQLRADLADLEEARSLYREQVAHLCTSTATIVPTDSEQLPTDFTDETDGGGKPSLLQPGKALSARLMIVDEPEISRPNSQRRLKLSPSTARHYDDSNRSGSSLDCFPAEGVDAAAAGSAAAINASLSAGTLAAAESTCTTRVATAGATSYSGSAPASNAEPVFHGVKLTLGPSSDVLPYSMPYTPTYRPGPPSATTVPSSGNPRRTLSGWEGYGLTAAAALAAAASKVKQLWPGDDGRRSDGSNGGTAAASAGSLKSYGSVGAGMCNLPTAADKIASLRTRRHSYLWRQRVSRSGADGSDGGNRGGGGGGGTAPVTAVGEERRKAVSSSSVRELAAEEPERVSFVWLNASEFDSAPAWEAATAMVL